MDTVVASRRGKVKLIFNPGAKRANYHGVFRASGRTFSSSLMTDAIPFVSARLRTGLTFVSLPRLDQVGEDGPAARDGRDSGKSAVMPQFGVIRPVDLEETAGAFVASAHGIHLRHCSLQRQTVPILNEIEVKYRRERVLRGRIHCEEEMDEARTEKDSALTVLILRRGKRRKAAG
jgi:transketolase